MPPLPQGKCESFPLIPNAHSRDDPTESQNLFVDVEQECLTQEQRVRKQVFETQSSSYSGVLLVIVVVSRPQDFGVTANPLSVVGTTNDDDLRVASVAEPVEHRQCTSVKPLFTSATSALNRNSTAVHPLSLRGATCGENQHSLHVMT